MKSITIEARIDAAVSAALQSNLPADQTLACVTRLISAFKEIGQAQQDVCPTAPHFFEDDIIFN